MSKRGQEQESRLSFFIHEFPIFRLYFRSLRSFWCFSYMLVSYKEEKQRNTEESIPWCKDKDQRGTWIRGNMQNGFSIICYGDKWRETCDSQHGRLQNCCVQRWYSSSDNWKIPTISQKTLVTQTLFRYQIVTYLFVHY